MIHIATSAIIIVVGTLCVFYAEMSDGKVTPRDNYDIYMFCLF